jgi:hypothetical protein
MIQFLPKEITWTVRSYSDNIRFQIAALSDVSSHRKMIVHADNAGLRVTKSVTEYMNHNSLKRAPHSPYSPNLAPSDFYRFGYFRHQLQGHEFTEGAELVSAISEILKQIPPDTMVDVLTIE